MKTLYGKVHDVLVLEDGTIYIKITDKDGNLIGGITDDSQEKSLLAVGTIDYNEFSYKILKADQFAVSSVKVSSTSAGIFGSAKNRMLSTEKYGNFIVGPTTFTDHPENIRIGGVYRLNGLMTSTMPSTIITPLSTLVIDMPVKDMLVFIAKLQSDFTDMLKELI